MPSGAHPHPQNACEWRCQLTSSATKFGEAVNALTPSTEHFPAFKLATICSLLEPALLEEEQQRGVIVRGCHGRLAIVVLSSRAVFSLYRYHNTFLSTNTKCLINVCSLFCSHTDCSLTDTLCAHLLALGGRA